MHDKIFSLYVLCISLNNYAILYKRIDTPLALALCLKFQIASASSPATPNFG